MKHNGTSLLMCMLCATTSMQARQPIAPYFSIRSQGFNAARKYAGITNKINRSGDQLYGALWTTFDYSRSFRPQRIAQCLFGDDALIMNSNRAAIQISGSSSTTRGPKDLLADYFGLPTDFKSIVYFRPWLDNLVFDCNWFQGLNEWIPGLYFSVQAPLVHTRWSLGMDEEVTQHGASGHYAAGDFGPNPLLVNTLCSNFTQFVSGCCAPTIFDCSATSTQPRIVFKALHNAKMDCSRRKKTRLAELTCTLGWNFLQDTDERYHAGLALRTSAPTGNSPWGEYLFEPVIGNGHHWEFGGELNGHYTWQLGDSNDNLSLFGDIVVVHQFKAHQRRTFDARNKPLSRYMLLQKLGPNTASVPHLANPPFPATEFANVFTSMANVSTIDIDVSVGLQAECLAMLTYQHKQCTWDIGYSFWDKTCEHITPTCAFASELETMPNVWAFKGDADVIGFDNSPDEPPVRLAATQSNATIHTGTNGTSAQPNAGIDAPQLATSNSPGNPAVLAGPFPGSDQTRSSVPPVYLTPNDISLTDARTHGASHKLFTHFMYTWDARHGWIPTLGCGAEAEFGTGNTHLAGDCCKKRCVKTCGCPCVNTSLSQWSIWIKGSVAF